MFILYYIILYYIILCAPHARGCRRLILAAGPDAARISKRRQLTLGRALNGMAPRGGA